MRYSLKNKMTQASAGFSMVEVVIALGVSVIGFAGAATLLANYVKGTQHFEIMGEVKDLEKVMKSRIDCRNTILSQKAKCDAGQPIAVYNASCTQTLAIDGTTRPAPKYAVRAICGKDDVGYFVNMQYQRFESDVGTTLKKDPLTGKTLDWATLLDRPVRCDTEPVVVRYGYNLPKVLNAVFNLGYTAQVNSEDHRMKNDTDTLNKICQSFGYQGFQGPLPTNKTDTSPNNNGMFRATPGMTDFDRVDMSTSYNPPHYGPYQLRCINPVGVTTCGP